MKLKLTDTIIEVEKGCRCSGSLGCSRMLEVCSLRVIRKKLEVEKEVEKSFTSRNRVGELWQPNEYCGSARGIYTRMVTCPFNFGREPIESFDERIDSR